MSGRLGIEGTLGSRSGAQYHANVCERFEGVGVRKGRHRSAVHSLGVPSHAWTAALGTLRPLALVGALLPRNCAGLAMGRGPL
jgi:hypothetical protein